MVAIGLKMVAVVGPTASGKTGLSVEIAKKYNGEVIAADSRTVYKGLNIGTAKPSVAEQQGIPHWGLDLVGPGEKFSVADFKNYADTKIAEILKRNKLPILVGGTGLYIDAVLYDFSLAPPNAEMRDELEDLGIIELQQLIRSKGYELPYNVQNKRHLVRVLERGGAEVDKKQLDPGVIIIGLGPPRDVLRERIIIRAKAMLEAGVMDEVKWALDTYPPDSEALTGGIYRIFRDVIWGNLPQNVVVEKFVYSDMHLAKRQMTWFKRNKDINWFVNAEDAMEWINAW
jgi:tRNA dimethylallyltransferase